MSNNSDVEASIPGSPRFLNHAESSPKEPDFAFKHATAGSFKNWKGFWEAISFLLKHKVQDNLMCWRETIRKSFRELRRLYLQRGCKGKVEKMSERPGHHLLLKPKGVRLPGPKLQ